LLDVFIAYSLWGRRRPRRPAAALAERALVRVGVDSREGVQAAGRDLTAVDGTVQLELGRCHVSDIALTALATVISRRANHIVVDAGGKVLGTDRPAWTSGFGRVLDHLDRIAALSGHHAIVEFPASGRRPALLERANHSPSRLRSRQSRRPPDGRPCRRTCRLVASRRPRREHLFSQSRDSDLGDRLRQVSGIGRVSEASRFAPGGVGLRWPGCSVITGSMPSASNEPRRRAE